MCFLTLYPAELRADRTVRMPASGLWALTSATAAIIESACCNASSRAGSVADVPDDSGTGDDGSGDDEEESDPEDEQDVAAAAPLVASSTGVGDIAAADDDASGDATPPRMGEANMQGEKVSNMK